MDYESETDDLLTVGDPIVVHTPDRRQYRGVFIGYRAEEAGTPRLLVRLDTGWQTSFPAEMVHRDTQRDT